jgi:Protein of unknown function (DUF1553)/Protein of unknown function (DUF1549)/Planctomycete cytochrome C
MGETMRLRKTWLAYVLLTVTVLCGLAARASASDAGDHFERRVRPLLIERCHKCHAGSKNKGGLRLDSREAVLKGGGAGPAMLLGKPDESLLLQAVRHQAGLAMPPDGRLNESEIGALAEWIKSGAVWPGPAARTMDESKSAGRSISPVSPNDGELAMSLQLWLRADSLALNDGDPVYVWPDQSGHGRDMSATKGVRPGGVGLPGRFASRSSVMRRPAVRFDTTTGLASSPGNLVEIRGDAALTIMMVLNLQRHQAKPPFDCVLGIGNPAHARDPGKPIAALVQINRDEDHALHFAGGWDHDASLARGSFKSHYGKPVLLTISKQPGPMRSTTRVFVDGVAASVHGGEPREGQDAAPDFQHRSDIGAYLGKALGWCGAIQGDVAEVAIYNKALDDSRRSGVEGHLAEKFGLWLEPLQGKAAAAVYSAEEKGFWAYQPVKDTAPPAVGDRAWVKTPIDRFILQGLEERRLKPAASVDKLTLLRRVTFDLIGLPPTLGEVAAFLGDNSSGAYEKVVNRLLDSRHYGERWGRHWLDVVRYAESTANDANAVMRYACRYRNYVIDAFNLDLPYDQFLIEQLSGDLLPPTDSIAVNTRQIIATGYLMVGPKALAETDKEQSRLDIIDDQIDVIGRSMLGLTLACARCHDHKFDAIRTTDYYALAGIFRSTEPFQNEIRNATMWWEFPVPQGAGVQPLMVMAPRESQPYNLRVHLRGNHFTLGKPVPRGVLQIVAAVGDPARHGTGSPVDPCQLSSGRLELARWIASPANPLTARVMANRIWQHHFGRGLVATSDNFGTRGERPSHPELLDWLACRFVESGWSVKAMHRLMVLSSTYLQGGTPSVAAGQADPDRKWRSSFPRRRLTAEELRDAMLAVSGQLDRSSGTNESGEILYEKAEVLKKVDFRPSLLAADDPFYTKFKKRTVYLPVVRNVLPDVLALFDAADPNGVTAVRNDTTVPSQSLFLLNSPFVREQARCFAERLLAAGELTDDQRIERAHATAFGRLPTPGEMSDSRDFFAAYMDARAAQGLSVPDRRLVAWQSFCQSLMCSNEFLYVE